MRKSKLNIDVNMKTKKANFCVTLNVAQHRRKVYILSFKTHEQLKIENDKKQCKLGLKNLMEFHNLITLNLL